MIVFFFFYFYQYKHGVFVLSIVIVAQLDYVVIHILRKSDHVYKLRLYTDKRDRLQPSSPSDWLIFHSNFTINGYSYT